MTPVTRPPAPSARTSSRLHPIFTDAHRDDCTKGAPRSPSRYSSARIRSRSQSAMIISRSLSPAMSCPALGKTVIRRGIETDRILYQNGKSRFFL